MSLTRREFITTGTLAALSVPLISGCTKKAHTTTANEIIAPSIVAGKPSYFEENFGITHEMIDQVLAKTMSRGGSFGDLFFEHNRKGYMSMRDGIVAIASSDVNLGVGVRCVNHDQVGYAYTESLTLEDMLRAAEAASAIAPAQSEVQIKPRHDIDFKRYYSQTLDMGAIDATKAIDILKKLESQARAKDPDIVQVTAYISWEQRNIMVNTSDGINAEDRQPNYAFGVYIVINRNGVSQSNGDGYSMRDDLGSITQDLLDKVVDNAYAQTEILFHAIKPKAGEWPVVMEAGDSAILLHEAIGHGLEADFNRKDLSVFSNKLNTQISSKEVTIGDSGIVEKSYGSYNMDDEGTPCQDTVLVENGVLKSYLHDRISAAHYGIAPTGSGRRQGYQVRPIPRMRVTYMKNGTHEKAELFEGIEYGILCSTFMNGQVNIGPGDYTFYVKNGYLIEHGKLTAPIKDVNLIGNGPDTLSKITMVANDYKQAYGPGMCGKDGQFVPVSFGMPSVRVSSITVGGE